MKKKVFALSAVLLMSLNQAHALDFAKFFENMFSKKAGYKSVSADGEVEKDLSKFLNKSCERHNPWGPIVPRNKEKDDERDSLFICRQAYNIRYDQKLKVPLWGTYILARSNYDHQNWGFIKNIKYTGNKLDPEIPNKLQPDFKDYVGTDYVPHNLVPIFDVYYNESSLSDEDMLAINQQRITQTYSAINTIPITKELNKSLLDFEAQSKKLLMANAYGSILMVTGPIFINGGKGRLGKDGPLIPTHIFKIFANANNKGTTSYIIPNDNQCATGCNMNKFIAPFTEIERLTGYNIFSAAAPEHAAKLKLDVNEYKRLR